MMLVLVEALVCGGCGAVLINSLTTVYNVDFSTIERYGEVGGTGVRLSR